MTEKIYEAFRQAAGVNTDTRSLKEGDIFFALKGPNFNANKFAKKAIALGALKAVIDDPACTIPGKTILVEDVLSSLQQLANHHRKSLDIPFLGITGSNGKTTTKELIHKVLSTRYQVIATKGNLNNHIGVPLTLLSVKEDTEIAIIEMGANRVGEIANLCSIAQPTHGVITNIGKAHIGLFGGFEGVIRGKSELYDYLLRNDGTVFINENQPILLNMAKRFSNPLLYPNEGNFYQCSFNAADPFVKLTTEEGDPLHSQLIGQYNFDNIATALCIGKYFKISPELSLEAIQSYVPENNRSQIIRKKDNLIILDAYNANPSSMNAAIENLKSMKAEKNMVILGDMFELGEASENEHQQIGEIVADSNFDISIFCGQHMKSAQSKCPQSLWFENTDKLKKHLEQQKTQGYHILIKGSRAMALEKIVASI